MIEASKMPLPEADKKLKLNTAFSAAGLATTGGTRRTSLSRPGIGIFGAAIPSRKPFVCGKPQTKTTTLRIIHGSQARNISDLELRVVSEARASARALLELALPDGRASDTLSAARSTRWLALAVLTSLRIMTSDSSLPSPGKRQMCFGCQNFRNVASDAIEMIDATTSTNHGP